MKKFASTILILCVFAVATAMSLTACSGSGTYKYDDADKYAVGGGALAVSSVNTLDINWVNGNVVIEEADVTDLTFSESADGEIDNSTAMRYWLSGTTLKIKFASSINAPRTFSLEKTLTIQVPSSVVKLFSKIKIEAVSSNIHVKSIDSTDADITTTSGAIVVDGGIFTKLECESTSGSINMTDSVVSNFEADNNSGKVSVSVATLPSIINIDTVSGSVSLVFAENDGFILQFDTVNGRFSSEFDTTKQSSRYVYKTVGRNSFTVDTTSGDLDVARRA